MSNRRFEKACTLLAIIVGSGFAQGATKTVTIDAASDVGKPKNLLSVNVGSPEPRCADIVSAA